MQKPNENIMRIIDPHVHLFDLTLGEYQWLKMDKPPFWPDKHLIVKNFSEQDLNLPAPLELAGFVHIEAGFDNQKPWREIAWLETQCTLAFRSIAMLDITLPSVLFTQQLEKLSQFNSVVGIRYILDDDAHAILSDTNCQINLEILAAKKLSFELQMSVSDTKAVKYLSKILTSVPTLKVSINHVGWPALDEQQHLIWLANIKLLAKFQHVYIKCSGYEMADRDYPPSWPHQIINHCIENFGIERVMLASNFPLNLFRASFQDTWLNNIAQPYTPVEIHRLCYSNAEHFYLF